MDEVMSDTNDITTLVESSPDEDVAGSEVADHGYDHDHADHKDHDIHDDQKHNLHDQDYWLLMRDVIMWRRRKASGLVLLVATVMWVLLQVYRFNLIPLASWMAMACATLLFLYGSFLRLLHKEAPNMEEWEVTEERAKEMAKSTKRMMERSIRWMFYVSCEREWYIFVAVVSALLALAYLGRYFDFVTFLYTGTLVGMTVPALYVNKEDEIKAYGEKVRVQGSRIYHKLDDKVYSKLNLRHKEKKEKKVE